MYLNNCNEQNYRLYELKVKGFMNKFIIINFYFN